MVLIPPIKSKSASKINGRIIGIFQYYETSPYFNNYSKDQVCFVGVPLVIRSILKSFPNQILLNYTPHLRCTPTKQT